MNNLFNHFRDQREQRNWSINFLGLFYPPFCNLVLTILQSSGKENKDTERLINSVIGLANTCSPSLRNFPARLSIPALLVGFISLKSFCTTATFVGLNEKVFPLIFSIFYRSLMASFLNFFGGVGNCLTKSFAKFE